MADGDLEFVGEVEEPEEETGELEFVGDTEAIDEAEPEPDMGNVMELEPIDIQGDPKSVQDVKTDRMIHELKELKKPAHRLLHAKKIADRLNTIYGANVNARHILETNLPQETAFEKGWAAAGSQFIDKATFGVLPDIYGAGKAAFTDDNYVESRQEARDALNYISDKSPIAGGVGAFAGAASSAVGATGALLQNIGARAAARGAGAFKQGALKFGTGVGIDIAESAARGFGESAGETLGERGADAARAAAFGGAISGGLRGLGTIGRAAKTFSKGAKRRTTERIARKINDELQDLGFTQKQREDLADAAMKGRDGPQEMLQWIRTNLPDGTTAEMRDAAFRTKQSLGDQMDRIVKSVDDGPVATTEFFKELGDRIQVRSGKTGVEQDVLKKAFKFIDNEIENIRKMGVEGYDISSLRRLRSALSKRIHAESKKGGADSAELVEAYDLLIKEMDDQIDNVLKQHGGPAGDQLQQLYKNYSKATDTVAALKRASAKRPSAVKGFIGGAFSGNPLLKAAELASDPAGSKLMDVLDKMPKEFLDKYGPQLVEAGNRGARSLAAKIFVLQRSNTQLAETMRKHSFYDYEPDER